MVENNKEIINRLSKNPGRVKRACSQAMIEYLEKIGEKEKIIQIEKILSDYDYSIKLKEILIRNKGQALFSKELAEIKKNVPIDFNPKDCQWGDYNKEKVSQILENLDFYSLIARLPSPGRKAADGPERLPKLKTKAGKSVRNLELW